MGNRIDIGQSNGRSHADELVLEFIFESLGAEAFGFVELVIADGDGRDRAVGIQLNGDSHGAVVALLGGGSALEFISRSRYRYRLGFILRNRNASQLAVCLIESIDNSFGSDGSTGDRIDVFELQHGHFANELSLELIFAGSGAEAVGFVELFIANGNSADRAVFIQLDSDNHRTRKTLGGTLAGRFRIAYFRNGSNFGSGLAYGHLAAQLSLNLIDRIHHSPGGDGRTGNGVDVFQSQRRHLADKLVTEIVFQRLAAIAFSLSEEIIADGDFGDGACIIQRQSDGHRTGKTLYAGGVWRSGAASTGQIHHKQRSIGHAAVYCVRGNRSARDGVDCFFRLFSIALDDGQRHGLTDILIGEGRLFGQRAQTGSLAEILTADTDAGDDIIAVHTNSHDDFTAVAADSGFHHVADRFAVGVKTLVAAVHSTAFFQRDLFKGNSSRKKLGARFFSGTARIFLDGAFGDQIENGQQRSGEHADHDQRHQIPEILLVHGMDSSFVCWAHHTEQQRGEGAC